MLFPSACFPIQVKTNKHTEKTVPSRAAEAAWLRTNLDPRLTWALSTPVSELLIGLASLAGSGPEVDLPSRASPVLFGRFHAGPHRLSHGRNQRQRNPLLFQHPPKVAARRTSQWDRTPKSRASQATMGWMSRCRMPPALPPPTQPRRHRDRHRHQHLHQHRQPLPYNHGIESSSPLAV